MTQSDRQLLRDVIGDRLDKAYRRLDHNPEYQEYADRKAASEPEIDAILKKLERDEVRAVKQFFYLDSHRAFDEKCESYLQGLRDCIKALAFLGVFNMEASA